MKRRVISMFVALVLLVTAAQPALAVEYNTVGNTSAGTTATVISREEYISAVAELEGLSYEVAEKRNDENVCQVARASDERVGYATIEKEAGTIVGKKLNKTDKDYTRTVKIAAYVAYVYNVVTGEPVEILEISAPYAFIDIKNFSIDYVDFDHGDYRIKLHSTTKGSITVIGQFSYVEDGISVGAGLPGNLFSVSKTVGGFKIVTNDITFSALFLLIDCPRR